MFLQTLFEPTEVPETYRGMFRHHGSALRELRRRSVASEEQCGPRNETAAAMLGIVCMARCSSGGSRVQCHVSCHVSRVV